MSLMFSLTAKLLGHQSSICEHNPPQECETQIVSSAAVMGTLYVNLDQNQNMKLDLIFFSKASVQWIKYLVGYDGMHVQTRTCHSIQILCYLPANLGHS